MKRTLVIAAIMAASVTYSTTAIPDEYTGLPDEYGQVNTNQIQGRKDQCLIVAKNCINDSETVMERVERLNREIKKGRSVYTPEELRNLQEQLNWINSDSAEFSGGNY